MRFYPAICFFLVCCLLNLYAQPAKSLEIGSQIPEFELQGVDGKTYTLNNFNKYEVLVIIFMSNHCPTSQAYEDKIIKLVNDFSGRKVGFIAISPNKPEAICYEDMAYSDLGDSFDEMKIRAVDKNFNFPYLFDGEKQEVTRAFGPEAIPHTFIFDKKRILCYQGRIDNIENPYRESTSQEAKSAILALLAGIDVIEKTTKVFGCPVKGESEIETRNKIDAFWNKKSVRIKQTSTEGINKIVENYNDNLVLLYFWSPGPVSYNNSLSELTQIHRMYNRRFFEVITIMIGKDTEKALELLKTNHAAYNNLYYPYELHENLKKAIHPAWNGSLPLTLLIEPEGKILQTWKGTVNPLEIKKTIIKEIGRFYAND